MGNKVIYSTQMLVLLYNSLRVKLLGVRYVFGFRLKLQLNKKNVIKRKQPVKINLLILLKENRLTRENMYTLSFILENA